jgi:spermidine synthase
LVVGLGGASLSNALATTFPEAEVVSVEIEPAVVEAAKECFFYRESDKVQTVVADARAYLEKNQEPFDVIFLDAFDGDGVPESLRTLEFARILDGNLVDNGAVVANIHLTPRKPSLRYQQSLSSVFDHNYMTVGVAQGVGLYTHHNVSSYPLVSQPSFYEKRYGLPLGELLNGRHQEDLSGVEPFRD